MISRTHRFHGYNSLRHVYKGGGVVRGPLFSVRSSLNPRRKTYRVAIVVSRKVNKSAVSRNRIRRRLYEIVRLLEPAIVDPHDIVITVFHDTIIEEDHKALKSQVSRQFAEAGVLAAKATSAPG